MRTVVTAFCFALGVVAGGPVAHGEPRIQLGGFLGGHYVNPQSELGALDFTQFDAPDSSIGLGLRVGVPMARRLTGEGELAFMPSKREGDKVSILGWRLQLRFDLTRPRSLRPFALIGIGGMSIFGDAASDPHNDTDFVTHGGVGVRYALSPSAALRFDLRGLLPPSRTGDGPTLDGEVWIGFELGFPRRAAAVAVGGGGGGSESRLPDRADPIPTSADGDGDGVADADDRAPNDPEDRDGYQDDDGVPDPDDDGDGIADADDRCPREAETVNAFTDTDGCPDEVPPALAKFTGVIRGINFANGKSKIQRSSFRLLDEAVTLLKQYPDFKVEIAGHTDNKGKAAANQKLSLARARAVRAYLVRKGIAADRLVAVGFGPDKPIAPNLTPSGRAQNRRIEFRLISQ